jgi:hypothetical protein
MTGKQGSRKMAAHKFAVGQTVQFSPDLGQDGRGRFTVVRLLPQAQYRVKSQRDGHERVVREGQLA